MHIITVNHHMKVAVDSYTSGLCSMLRVWATLLCCLHRGCPSLLIYVYYTSSRNELNNMKRRAISLLQHSV